MRTYLDAGNYENKIIGADDEPEEVADGDAN
jgi:hypothetical protein